MITQFKYYDYQTEDMCNDYLINDFQWLFNNGVFIDYLIKNYLSFAK